MSDKRNFLSRIQQLLTLDNALCLILSICCSFNAFCSINMSSGFQGVNNYSLPICIFIASVAFCIFKFVFKKTSNIQLTSHGDFKKRELSVYASLILIACTISVLWNYPASMHNDAINQYHQAISGQYNDTHPLLHTLIFFKIPSIIWNSYTSCAIFQCLFIFVILIYFCYFSRKYFLNQTQTIVLLTYILINPTFLKMATTPLKDVPFSYCLMIGTMFLIEIIITSGEWLETTRNKILFCLMCLGVVFFRHNGIASFILMTIPLIVVYKTNRKLLVTLFIVFTTSKIMIAPILNILRSEESWPASEIIGVPLNHPLNTISYIYNNNGIVSEHNMEIMSNINRLENWRKYYDKYSFYNFKKAHNGYNDTYVAQNWGIILKTWLQMTYTNPVLAIKSEVYITSGIWRISNTFNFMSKKHLQVNYTGPQWISRIMNGYVQILQRTHLKNIMIDVGEGLLFILISLCLTIRKKQHNKKAYLPYVLVLSNVLVITCLVTSGTPRFVYSSILCAYPLILYALYNKQTKMATSNNELTLA